MHHLAYIIRRKRINFPIAFKFIGQFIITGNKSKKKAIGRRVEKHVSIAKKHLQIEDY